MDDLYTLGAVKIGATVIGGIMEQECEQGNTVTREAASGEVYARLAAIISKDSEKTFATRSIATALAAIGTTGGEIGSGGLGDVVFYYRKLDRGTVPTGDAISHTINDGIILPRSLSVDNRGIAQIDFQVMISDDGVNDPVIVNASDTMPALGSENEQLFTLGTAKVANNVITKKKSVRVDFGLTGTREMADSEIEATFTSLTGVLPVITIAGIDSTWATSLGLAGIACTHANSYVQFRKLLHGGSFVADGSAVHPKLTFAGIADITKILGASQGRTAQSAIRVSATYDGTNSPLVYSAAAFA